MKNSLLTSLITLLIFSGSTEGHDLSSALNPAANATDYYQVLCSHTEDGGDAIQLDVSFKTKTKSAPVINVQVKTSADSTPFAMTNLTDPINGDSGFSREISISNSYVNGYYYIAVNKTKIGKQSYQLIYHCLGANGHTGTGIETLQKDFP